MSGSKLVAIVSGYFPDKEHMQGVSGFVIGFTCGVWYRALATVRWFTFWKIYPG